MSTRGLFLTCAGLVLSTAQLALAQQEVQIAIEVAQDGEPIPDGATVSGVIDATFTIIHGHEQHVQLYQNFVPIVVNRAGDEHADHDLGGDDGATEENPDGLTQIFHIQIDTSKFFDGENLLSAHVHPHNQPGRPFQTRFAYGTLKILTQNRNPAPSGDRLLPELTM